MGGYTSPALTGPPEAGGRLMANVPPLGKTFFRKSTKKSGMSTFGSKTKVVRTEILHILVPKPSRGDLYLTISRFSRIFQIFPQTLQIWPSGQASGLGSQGCQGWQVRFLVYVPRCFWGGAKAFSAGEIHLPQNYTRGPRVLMMFFWWFLMIFGNFDDFWWFLVIPDDFWWCWWFLMILDYFCQFWWFLMILDDFC